MRSTKLSRFCEGVIEASWLAALVLAPLFFDTYSTRVFEPDKIALVRTIALIIAAAWGIKIVEKGGARGKIAPTDTRGILQALSHAPLVLPVASLLTVYLISTLLSIAPRTSTWGSYTRLQGTYTLLSYLILFAAVAVHLRRREQVERMITTIILASLPVSLYGIMQRLQIDPLPWGEDVSQRVASTLGNAIFVAAYLIMAVPLTTLRVLMSFRIILREEKIVARNIAHATVYVFIATMQLLAIWFSGSRGPWLGLLAGLFFGAILLTLIYQRRRIAFAILGLAGAMAAFLIVLNIPNGPLEPLRNTEPIGRLGRVFEVQDGTSIVRVLIWKGAVELILPHDPIVYPDGRTDALNLIRPLIGYGPETMYVAFNRFYSPEIAHYERRTASPDRSHNETFDALVMTGVLGLLAYLALFAAVIYYGLKWIGVLAPQDKWLYVGLFVGGGIAGAAIMVIWKGAAYFGVGLPFGMLLGLLAFAAYLAVNRSPNATTPESVIASPEESTLSLPKGAKQSPPGGEIASAEERRLARTFRATVTDDERALILAALLAAVIAHFTEIHFGIAIVSTRLHFWAFAGVMIAVGWAMPLKTEQAAPAEQTTELGAQKKKGKAARKAEKLPAPNIFAPALPAVLTALILITMSYDFLTNPARTTSIPEMLVASFTTLYGTSGATSYGMIVLFVTVWLAAVALWSDDLRMAAITLGESAVLWIIFVLYHLSTLGTVAGHQAQDIAELIRIVLSLSNLYTAFNVWVMLLVALAALALVVEWPVTFTGGQFGVPAASLAFAAAFAAGYFTNMLIIRANVVFKVAEPVERRADWDVAIPIYDAAIKLAPLEDAYYLSIGRAYLEKSSRVTEAAAQEELLKAAESELKIAEALNPLNPDHSANLARLYQRWARLAADPNAARARADEADKYYGMALALSPNTASLWNEWARLNFGLRGNDESALAKLETSLSLDDQFNETYLSFGDYWSQLAKNETGPAAQRSDYENTVSYYRQAIAAEAYKPDTPPSLSARLGLAGGLKALERWDEAIAAYEEVIRLAGNEYNLWAVYNALAESYLENGDKARALENAQKALAAVTNEEDKAAVQVLIDRIGQ